VEYPKTHDPAPVLARALQARGIGVDPAVVDSLMTLSRELAEIRGPAFYQEALVADTQTRHWVARVERAQQFGEELLQRLRKAR
jgi:hypothetical protein